MSEAVAEYFTPENTLIKKVGTGGLPESTLNAIQARVESMSIDSRPFLKEKIKILKQCVYSDDFLGSDVKDPTSDFLSNLVAFSTNVRFTQNNGLVHISNQILKFVERANSINMDVYHVIKAHINALDIILKKEIDASNHPIIKALIDELDDACERYNQKYKVDMTS